MSTVPPRDPFRLAVGLILTLSFGLRAFIAWRGGQWFWPDEDRFEVSRHVARLMSEGRFYDAVGRLLAQPDHLLFKTAGLLPAGLEVAWGTPGWFSALFFAAASTWVLWLVHRVSRAAGGGHLEALIVLILAASATSLFYYSRHFLPYDLSLGLFLLSLICGLRPSAHPRNSLLTGFLACLGFLAYNGYWSLGAVLLGTHVLLALPQGRAMATRLTYALLGLTLPLFALALLSRVFGHDFFALLLSFAGTANQGELDRAWLFTVQYLWSAERGLAVLLLLALLFSLGRLDRSAGLRTLLWPALTLALGALLLLPPGYFHHFAVTARHVRVLVPFLCLTAAWVLCHHPRLLAHPRVVAGTVGLVVLQAAFNFARPLAQVFPREFEQMAIRLLAGARESDLGPYKIVNAAFLHDASWAPAGPDPGRVLLRHAHPFQFAPYLYEGYSLALREGYLQRDLSMRVLRLDAGGPPLRGYPAGMLELVLRFPEKPAGLLPEPLLSTGSPGRGDLLFLRYEGHDRFVIGHDHIGGGATLAASAPLDRRQPHRVIIGMDAFFPPDSASARSRRFVLWNDRLLLHGRAEQHPTSSAQIAIGHNFIGASTAVLQLSADIVSFRRLPFPQPGTVFPEPPGALRFMLLPDPTLSAGLGEPLLSSGPAGRGDLLFLRHGSDGRFRVGFDRWGVGAVLSAPFEHDSASILELIVSLGSFHPPEPVGGLLTRRLFVSANGRVLLNRYTSFHPAAADELMLGRNHAASTTSITTLSSDLLVCEPVPAGALLPLPAGHPGALHLRLQFPAPPQPGRRLPILCTGTSGAGDLLFMQLDPDGRFRIGHDQWGHSSVLSEPHPFDPTRPLELTISMGSLFSSAGDDGNPERGLRDRLFVARGQEILLNQAARFHAARAGDWVVGWNRIGSSSAE